MLWRVCLRRLGRAGIYQNGPSGWWGWGGMRPPKTVVEFSLLAMTQDVELGSIISAACVSLLWAPSRSAEQADPRTQQ